MKTAHLPLFVALIASALPVVTFSQASEPVLVALPEVAASVPLRSGPRLLTPAEKRDNADAAAAPDLRPDRPVVPQISIPLGRKPPVANTPASAPPRRGATAVPGHIGDSAARCEALTADVERSLCRKRLAQAKAPG